MSKESRFEQILEECLERMARGQAIGDCLEAYPDDAAELAPLLATASSARRVAGQMEPRPEFKIRARYEMREKLAQANSKPEIAVRHWKLGWAGALAIVLVLAVSGAGTAAVAANSMPDEALYPVKLVMEEARVALATSPTRKAAVLAELADKRVEELVYVAEKGDAGRVEAVTNKLNGHLETVAALSEANGRSERTPGSPGSRPGQAANPASPQAASGREALKKKVEERAIANEERLNKALEKAPASVKPSLARSVEQTRAAYDKALKSVSKEPPGQAKKTGQSNK